jgi:hypothetical protein
MYNSKVLELGIISRGTFGFRGEVSGDKDPIKFDYFCRYVPGKYVSLYLTQFPDTDSDELPVRDKQIARADTLDEAFNVLADLAFCRAMSYSLLHNIPFDSSLVISDIENRKIRNTENTKIK